MIFTSLNNMTMSRFIYVAINGIISFFSMAEQYSIVCVCVCVCIHIHTHIHHIYIHLSVNGHLGYF